MWAERIRMLPTAGEFKQIASEPAPELVFRLRIVTDGSVD